MEKNYQEVLVKKNVETNESLMECVANVFSAIMEEEVTPQQSACILNLIAAVIMTVFPVSLPVIVRLIFLVWMGVAAYQCKKTGMLNQ